MNNFTEGFLEEVSKEAVIGQSNAFGSDPKGMFKEKLKSVSSGIKDMWVARNILKLKKKQKGVS